MDEVLMISDVAWVRRGVAKAKPEKVKLDDEQLKELIQGGMPDTTDQDSDAEDEVNNDVEMDTVPEQCQNAEKKKGLRGSAPEDSMEDTGKTIEETYMKDYDKDDEDQERGFVPVINQLGLAKAGVPPNLTIMTGMRGIATFVSNKDDPYVTNHVDSDEDEEKDDIEIRPDDNMVVMAKIHKDDYTMDVYVYNEKNSDWYVHHDYILDAPPLCLEHVGHDPGNDATSKGNLMAVGTMNNNIDIWDVDIMNACEPVVRLGAKAKPGKRKKRDGSAQGHTDAVISLAWNNLTPHVLASGGADKTVLLWDLDEAKPAQCIPDRGAEVQSIVWHPVEATYLLCGTMKGDVQVVDCSRTDGEAAAKWNFSGQVEKVRWNHFNPFTAFVASDDGTLRHIDIRKPGEILWEGKAHDESIGGISLSASTKGLLVTAGGDQMLNIWKVEDSGEIRKIHSMRLALGPLHAAAFCPDVGGVCVVGGSAADLSRVMDLSRETAVVEAFGSS